MPVLEPIARAGRGIRAASPSLAVALAVALFTVIVFRMAWVSDDAYITLRTVDNFVKGHGLSWNPAERVQTFTHPLWMMLLTAVYWPTRDAYFTAIVLSILVSFFVTLFLAYRLAPNRAAAVVGVLLLSSSWAYMDYTTSGLENPLSHLLALVFLFYFLREDADTPRNVFRLSCIAALAIVTRMDLILLFFPALVYLCRGLRDVRNTAAAAAGALPFVVWEIFSLVYYGSLVPNTAHAKLSTGIPSLEVWGQGFVYLYEAARHDPVTPFMILTGLLIPWVERDRKSGALVLGVFLYVLYTVRVGGDFMAGRFLSTPFVLSVGIFICALPRLSRRQFAAPLIAAAYLGLFVVVPPMFSGPDHGKNGRRFERFAGITDERGFYFQSTGLFRESSPERTGPRHKWILEGQRHRREAPKTVRHQSVGIRGYYAGPKVHIIDTYALCDPLLARLPAIYKSNWRVGHYSRAVPAGYDRTVDTGENHLADPDLAEYYEHLRRATRGPLFTRARWESIWLLNTRQLEHLVDHDGYRFHHNEKIRRTAQQKS